ncbi:hypothetical protein [Pseudomonas amygdali]|uniref:hypothetical protein n=1 Tax=Pseudomonas amygdali TaxID=47877 RepID=UPI001E2B0D58|nr:hypothetical protein [Pseudomonas amygdali]
MATNVKREQTLEVIKNGDILTINGEAFDFSPMPEGATLPVSAIKSEWFFGDAERTNGVLTLVMWLPLPANYSQEQAFPRDLVNVPDGPVVFPKPLPTPPKSEVDA